MYKSVLPCISKILEKIIYKRLFISLFWWENSSLFKKRFGFRGHHSMNHVVLELIDETSEAFSKQDKFLRIFLDLSKAFDTVDLKTLLNLYLQIYNSME